jgi:hypothetical protein
MLRCGLSLLPFIHRAAFFSVKRRSTDKALFCCCCAKGCFVRFANLEDIALKVNMGYIFAEITRLGETKAEFD